MVDTSLELTPTQHVEKANALASSEVGVMETVIRPRSEWVGINWRELWHSRDLLFMLIYRDIKARYKQTKVGPAWAIIQPLISMLIFTLVFGVFARINTGEIPYPVFVLGGLIPWTFVSTSLSTASWSMISHQSLITKIYFPRLYLPAANLGLCLVDLGISLVLYFLVMGFYRFTPSWTIVFLPFVIVLLVLACFGIGSALSALSVQHRDILQLMPSFLQVLMYLSPIVYPAEVVPRKLHAILAINPVFGIVSTFRALVLGTRIDWMTLSISAASALVLFVVGTLIFRGVEAKAVDLG